jgi:hypothetical protein
MTLELIDHPGEVVTHEPGSCAGCGNGLLGAEVTATERRQVVDLPEDIQVGEVRARHRARHKDLCIPYDCATASIGSGRRPISAANIGLSR